MVASLWPTRRLLPELGCRLAASGHMERPEQVFYLSKVDLLGLLCGHWDGHGAGTLAHDLSHVAIVAREYGLPAVVNIPDILSHIKDDDAATIGRLL